MKENEYVQRPSHSTGLTGTQFSTLYRAGINDPEGPEKYNTEVKNGATFYSCHSALDTVVAVVEYKNLETQ
jgi:hypothetical protein